MRDTQKSVIENSQGFAAMSSHNAFEAILELFPINTDGSKARYNFGSKFRATLVFEDKFFSAEISSKDAVIAAGFIGKVHVGTNVAIFEDGHEFNGAAIRVQDGQRTIGILTNAERAGLITQ